MRHFLASRPSLVWLTLVAATFLSFESMTLGEGGARAARIAILCIALIKVMLVGFEFMELRLAPTFLKLPFILWCVTVFAILLVLTWSG